MAEKEVPDELAVCLSTLYRKTPNWLMLVQFIEYYLIHGATKLYVYYLNGDADTEAVIKHYVALGIIEIVHWSSEPCSTFSQTTRKSSSLCQTTMENDCTFKTAYLHKYILSPSLPHLLIQ